MEFVMSMSTSNITPTYQIDPEQQLRIKARYNATVRHTGTPSYAALCYLTLLSLSYAVSSCLMLSPLSALVCFEQML